MCEVCEVCEMGTKNTCTSKVFLKREEVKIIIIK